MSKDQGNKPKGILLINLGSPESLKVRDVRRYLSEFLMDKRIIDLPYLFRFLIVYVFVLPFRPKKSAEAYKHIWTKNGSPLVENTRKLAAALQKKVKNRVEFSMRYGKPSIKETLKKFEENSIYDIYVIPLFPHYAMSSYETCVEETQKAIKENHIKIKARFHAPFYNDIDYIEALFDTLKPYLKKKYDHLVFSYHGIPLRHLKKTDTTKKHCMIIEKCCEKKSKAHKFCYKHQSIQTSKMIAKRARIKDENYTICYQSRFGKDSWLSPFTEETIVNLVDKGKKDILVMCPSFTADCLETLEEIGIRARELFFKAGGKNFTLVPSLNDNKIWVSILKKWIEKA